MKSTISVGIYFALSFLAYAICDSSWFVSFLMGPTEHLGLAFRALNNGNLYLDGMSRNSGADYILSMIKVLVWLVGMLGVGLAFTKKSKPVYWGLCLFWIIVGVYNVYDFAISSV
jgi:hypothetical protein